MKILFAVNNDNISETIAEKYQKDYMEVISYKNVYYFNAIIKELQGDTQYDKIVVSEDLEPFANNNYDTIDKFIFEKLERISEEIKEASGKETEVVLICADRRNKSDSMLTKIFEIGIYNALIGEERTIDNLCKLLNQPRTKKEAKIAYKIEGNSIGYQTEDENSVSESEIQNILTHYKRLGKNEDKYVDSFNNIVSQYTDTQLKIIIRYLPLNVKAVLEERSPKYQQLSTFSNDNNVKASEPYRPRNLNTIQKNEEKIEVQMLDGDKTRMTKPVVIPSALKTKKSLAVEPEEIEPEIEIKDEFEDTEEMQDSEVKRGRGRPKKSVSTEEQAPIKPKRGRGRPKKDAVETAEDVEDEFDIDLFNITPNEEVISNDEQPEDMDFDLFNMDESDVKRSEPENLQIKPESQNIEDEKEEEEVDLFGMDAVEDDDTDLFDAKEIEQKNYMESSIKSYSNLSSLLTREKKIVSFVGTTKNGTSFIINNLALILSSMNISTAVLDLTKNKNSYYIFTKNDERLRKVASDSISNLEQGVAQGISINNYCTVYTEVPNENQVHNNIENILVTLMRKHDVVLIDTDFSTPIEYFKNSQEIYLVQSMDILTIQPLTAFLRNLKAKNVLEQEKIKIVINKAENVRNLSDKILIGGISSYNDPAMAYMTELFDRDNVRYCRIPFEVQNYVKYLDSIVNCEISLRGYTKQFMYAINELAGMVYPLLNKSKYNTNESKKNKMQFSSRTNNTLNQMRKNY